MDKRLEKIKKIFEKEEYDKEDMFVWDEEDWQAFEILNLVNFCIQDDEVLISFYSNVHPSTSAGIINMLHWNKVKDFCISGTIYPDLKDGEYVDMLFDEEADARYLQTVYEKIRAQTDFAQSAVTVGSKQ